MSRTAYRELSALAFPPGPCPGPFPPRPWCCRSPQPPWPEGVPHATATERGQWRRASDGRTLFVHGIDEAGPIPTRCDIYVTDPEGRQFYAVMTAWTIATTFLEVLDGAPGGIPTVYQGDRRRAEGGVLVTVGWRGANGEHALTTEARATTEESKQIGARTYSPAEILRLFPDLVTDEPTWERAEETLAQDPRGQATVEARAPRRVVLNNTAGLVMMLALLGAGTGRST